MQKGVLSLSNISVYRLVTLESRSKIRIAKDHQTPQISACQVAQLNQNLKEPMRLEENLPGSTPAAEASSWTFSDPTMSSFKRSNAALFTIPESSLGKGTLKIGEQTHKINIRTSTRAAVSSVPTSAVFEEDLL